MAASLLACGGGSGGEGTGETDGTSTSTSTASEPSGSTAADGSSDDDSGSATAVSCDEGAYEDDIVLTATAELPGAAHRAVTTGEQTLVCGDGFAALVGASMTSVSDVALAGTCTGIDALGDRALMTTDAGAVVLVSLDPLEVLDAVTTDAPRFDVLFEDEGAAWIAEGTAGVASILIEDDALTTSTPLEGAQDARGLARVGDQLLVADGYVLGDIDDPTVGGARYVLIDPAGGGASSTLVQGPGFAHRVAVVGEHIVGVRPGFGLDLLDVEANTIEQRGSVELDEVVHDVAGRANTLIAAAGTSLVRVAIDGETLTKVSSEDRPDRGALLGSWFRTVVASEDTFATGHGTSWSTIELGAADPAPEIAVDVHTYSMTPDQAEALFGLENRGTAPLVVREVSADPPFSAEVAADINGPTPGCTDHFVVEPGARLLFWLRHDGTPGQTTSPIRILSDDPDEPELVALAERGRPPLEVGEAAEDFFALGVDGRGFRLSDHLGKVVLAKLYNPL